MSCWAQHPAAAAQVLFGIGPSQAYEALKARRLYFLLDLLSPWAALAVAGELAVEPAIGALVRGLLLCAACQALGHDNVAG